MMISGGDEEHTSAEQTSKRKKSKKITRKRTMDQTAQEGREYLERFWGPKKTKLVSEKINERCQKINESKNKKNNAKKKAGHKKAKKCDDDDEKMKSESETSKDEPGNPETASKEKKVFRKTIGKSISLREFKKIDVCTQTISGEWCNEASVQTNEDDYDEPSK